MEYAKHAKSAKHGKHAKRAKHAKHTKRAKHAKRRTGSQFWPVVLVSVLLVALVFVCAPALTRTGESLLTTVGDGNNIATADSVADASTVTATPAPTLVPDATTVEQYAYAKAQNSDTMGWLTVTGTDIDNPLMQSTNNTDYLSLNELGQYDGWGSYFADYYANLTSAENLVQNTVIYGHSENPENPDGVKFSQLYRYLEQDFLEDNPYIYLTVGSGDDVQTLTFEIFAVFFTEIDFYYIDPNPSDTDFDAFISTVQAKNEYLFEDYTVTETDKLLTLSTCSHRYDSADTGDQRLVIMAKQVSLDFSITQNPDPERPT